MPQPIYLPRHPSFMEQFLQTGAIDNIMQSIMMGVQNRREDEKTIRGYQEQGYAEADYTAPTPEEAARGYGGVAGSPTRAAPGQWKGNVYDKSRQVSVAGRQFQRPVEPKVTFGIEKGTGDNDWEIVRKGNQIVTAKRVKPTKDKDTRSSLIKGYEYALQQHEDGLAKHPGSYTEWSRRQRRSSATRISIGEQVKAQTEKQIAKMQTDIRSPKFKENARASVMRTPDSDLWETNEVELKTREKMDKDIRALHPDKTVTFEAKKRKDGSTVLGWWIGNKLIRLAE